MDPLLMALLAEAGAKGVGQIAQAGSQFATGRDLRLDEEEKKRLRELERLEALNQFGLTPAQREAYQAQALSPVQAAERQALAQFGASQAIGDIGQGAAFRQQQALKQGSEEARAKVAMATAEKEAQAAQQQAAQLEALQAQERKSRQLQRDAAFGLLGGLAQAAGEAAGTYALNEAQQNLYDKKLRQLTGVEQQTADATRSMLNIEPPPVVTEPAQSEPGFEPKTRAERDAAFEEQQAAEKAARQEQGILDRSGMSSLDQIKMDVFGKKPPAMADKKEPIIKDKPKVDPLGQDGVTAVDGLQNQNPPQTVSKVLVPNTNLQGFLVPDESSIVVPSEDSANPMSITYYDPATGRNLGKIMFSEAQNTEQGRNAWAQATQELRLAMGEGFAGESAQPAVGSLLDAAVDREMSQIPDVVTFQHSDGTQYQPETDAEGNVIMIIEVTPDGQRFTNRPTDPTWASTLNKYNQAKGGQ